MPCRSLGRELLLPSIRQKGKSLGGERPYVIKGTEDMKQDSGKQRRYAGPDKGRLSIRITG